MAWRYQIVIFVTDKAESEECSLSWKQGASPLQSARWLWTRAASGLGVGVTPARAEPEAWRQAAACSVSPGRSQGSSGKSPGGCTNAARTAGPPYIWKETRGGGNQLGSSTKVVFSLTCSASHP